MPSVRVRQIAPPIYMLAQLINDRSRIILLLCRREPFTPVKDDLLLRSLIFSFPGVRDRRNEFCASSGRDDWALEAGGISYPGAGSRNRPWGEIHRYLARTLRKLEMGNFLWRTRNYVPAAQNK